MPCHAAHKLYSVQSSEGGSSGPESGSDSSDKSGGSTYDADVKDEKK